jgi:hypothetical protein
VNTKPDYRYSGDKSETFWKRVNKFRGRPEWDRLYRMGCLLQTFESFVLNELTECERPETKE